MGVDNEWTSMPNKNSVAESRVNRVAMSFVYRREKKEMSVNGENESGRGTTVPECQRRNLR